MEKGGLMSRVGLNFVLVLIFAISSAAAASTQVGAPNNSAGPPAAPDLAQAPPQQLLAVYSQLRNLAGSDRYAIAENVVWKRDAGTFTFRDGRLAFAAPVEGHVLAAVFTGEGTFELTPPGATERHQIARFTKEPKLEDTFREAVFFFTDDSWAELQKLVNVRGGGDADATTKSLAFAQKRYQNDFNAWWENQRKGFPTMRNLAARMLADLSDPTSRGFFLADIKTQHYSNLLYHISWNRDSLLLPEDARGEEVTLIRYRPAEYFEWWAGFHLASEYLQTPHPEHLTLLAHCREEHIDADVGKNDRLSASAEMQFEVPTAPARVLPLNLEGVLRISAVTGESGQKISFIQEDRNLDSDPWIILPAPAVPGQVYKIKIAYDEESTRESRIIYKQGDGLYFVTARESWYPSFGAFDDRTMFTLHFTSPKRFKFVATGRLVKSGREGNELETDWQSEIPYSVAGFNYGDFVDKSQGDSNLTVTAYSGKQIPDQLKNLQNAMDIVDLARGPSGQGGGVAAQLGIMTGGFNTAHMAGYAAAESYQAMRLYSFYFGALPFKTVSVTEQPVGSFGQSWPTLIFLPYTSLLDATTRHGLRMDQTAEEREFFNVVAVHELAHQWWGHLVGWKTYHDEWMSEGFADFSAALYLEEFEPAMFKPFWDLCRRHLLEGNKAGHRPVDVGPIWLNYQTDAYLEPETSYILRYEKGAYVLQMLRILLQDSKQKNPDAPFIAMMHDFTSTYAAKNASTQDFERCVEKHTGEPMDWFFNEWVYGTEVPHYDFSYTLKDGGNGKTLLQASLAQSGVSDSFLMRVPVFVSLNGTSRRLGFISVKGSTTVNPQVLLPFRPDKVTIDDDHSLLAWEKQ